MRISLRTLGVLAVVAVVGAALVLGVDAMAASGVGEHVTPFAILANAAAPAADIDKLRNSVDKFMNAFEEFKTTNDENLRKRDVLLDDKLDKINKTLDGFEPLNQKITKAVEGQSAMQEQLDQVEKALNRPNRGKDAAGQDEEYRNAFEHCLRRPQENRDSAHVAIMVERRNTLVKGDDAGAGYLLAPPDVNREIIKDVIEMSPMRSIATVRIIGGPSLKQPKRTAAAGAATRVGEVQPRANTGDPTYGMLQIDAPEMFARGEISLQMLEDADYDLVGELRSEFSDQFGVKESSEFVGGSGAANQAQGFLDAGAGLAEVVSGDATKVTGDGLVNLWAALKNAYESRAIFTLNRKTLGEVRKLKTTDGQYLWLPGIAGSVPNTILGSNYLEFPDMPDVAAGSYPIAYGDFRRGYVIVDRVAISFQPDYTTGADNGVVIFRCRKRVGGAVRQPEAIKKLKISA